MSSTGTTTREVEGLRRPRCHDLDGRRTAEEARDLVDRPDRRRETDALRGLLEQRVEPLEADRQVRAALGGGDRVHLVDDDRVHALERLAGLARQHQIERLGRRDEDVGRSGDELAPVGRGRVAGAHADRDAGHGDAEPPRGLPDPDERRAEVALDVDAERLERARCRGCGWGMPRPSGPATPLRRRRRAGAASFSRKMRSIAHRNAERVFPEPVGATTSACLPCEIASQAPTWAGVGAANAPPNQSCVAGPNRSSTVLISPSSLVGTTFGRSQGSAASCFGSMERSVAAQPMQGSDCHTCTIVDTSGRTVRCARGG